MDLTRTTTNNHKRLYEVNESTTVINKDLEPMSTACIYINDLNQNDLEQFEGTICNVLYGINNTYDRKILKEDPNLHYSVVIAVSMDTARDDFFKKKPRRESTPRPKEISFYGEKRNNQNIPNRQINSNNINGRQLPSTPPPSLQPFKKQNTLYSIVKKRILQ